MSKIGQEILEKTQQKARGKKENDSDYMSRLANAVSEMSDEDYQNLSEPAQQWFTVAAAALSEEPAAPENIKPFSDFDVPENKEEPESKSKNNTSEPTPSKGERTAKKVEKQKTHKKEKPKPTKPPSEKPATTNKPPKSPRVSVVRTIQQFVCKNPDCTKEEVVAELKAQKLATKQTAIFNYVFGMTKRIIGILNELKKLK